MSRFVVTGALLHLIAASLPLVLSHLAALSLEGACVQSVVAGPAVQGHKTDISIVGEDFYINGAPAYKGRFWQGHRIEGLLLNARMVQGIYDDLNTSTVTRWAYPDTGKWDAERNTLEFTAAMPELRRQGLLGEHKNRVLSRILGSDPGLNDGIPRMATGFPNRRAD